MKRILMYMILMIFGYGLTFAQLVIGETRYHFSGINDSLPTYLTTVGEDTMKTCAPFSALVVLTILQLYKNYEIECYADSSIKMTHHASKGQICLYDFDCIISSHWWNETIRRQPTFEGFVEFLRRKLKR